MVIIGSNPKKLKKLSNCDVIILVEHLCISKNKKMDKKYEKNLEKIGNKVEKIKKQSWKQSWKQLWKKQFDNFWLKCIIMNNKVNKYF